MKLNRGDIVIANLESVSKGSIQKYTRPYIIISNNKANQYSPVVTAVAMSTKTWKKKYLPYPLLHSVFSPVQYRLQR